MAEFKKLSDVEVVAEPTKSANVLIEEDGVIKKAPKAVVGGSIESDLVINIDAQPSDRITANIITFTEGSIDNVLSAFSEKRIPIVKLKFFKERQNNYCYVASELIANVYKYGNELYFSYIYPMVYNGEVYNGFMRFTTDGVFETHERYRTDATKIT